MDVSTMTHQELYKLEDQIEDRRKALYELEPKFLPNNIREKIKEQLIEFDQNNGYDDFVSEDYELHPDKDLVLGLSGILDGDEEENPLLQEVKGYMAEWEMLSEENSHKE
jgi:hypothetical protein